LPGLRCWAIRGWSASTEPVIPPRWGRIRPRKMS